MNNKDFGNKQKHAGDANSMAHALSSCERANDLIACLYNEATEAEARSFAAHMRDCAACRAESASLGMVRESIAAWRTESLGFSSSTALHLENAFVSEAATETTNNRVRAAFAALREFFTVSPAWMSAATAFAVIAVCALAAIGVSNAEFNWNAGGVSFRTHVVPVRVVEKTVQVEKPLNVGYSEEELNAQVDERVQQRLAEMNLGQMNLAQKPKQELVAEVVPTATARKVVKRNTASPPLIIASANSSVQPKNYNAPLPRANRVEIADEKDLPRLSDLLKDGSER